MCTIDKLVEENFQDVSNDEDDSQELISPSFNEALRSVETLSEYILCHTIDMMEKKHFFFQLNSINNALHRTKRNSAHITFIKDFFKNFKVIKNVYP